MTTPKTPDPAQAPAKPGTREAPYSVSRVVVGVNRTLERAVGHIWIEGEVTSLSRPASGHVYFSLRDPKAELRAVMWRSDAARLKFTIENGMALRARVRLGLYEHGGKFQLYVQSCEPAGVGADALALEALRNKLAAEGLFESRRKRALPILPRRIGVVTSKTGAAIGDIVNAVQRRFPIPILIAHAQVQGATAAAEIAFAIREVCRAGVDVVIVGRGGGSAVDLSAFNDERVVRAVAGCPVPVISAVGHEVDISLTDLAADHRAATPTMAGEMTVPALADLAAALDAIEQRLARELRYRVESSRQGLDALASRSAARTSSEIARRRVGLARAHRALAAAHPRAQLGSARRQTENLASRLEAAWLATAARRRQILGAAASSLEALSPLRVLERGYAIASLGDVVLRDASAVAPGDQVAVRLRRGELQCLVETVRDVKAE